MKYSDVRRILQILSRHTRRKGLQGPVALDGCHVLDAPVIIVGFNILRMDIPLLIQKGAEHEIRELDELNAFWHDTFTIDLFQQLLLSNKNMFSGIKTV